MIVVKASITFFFLLSAFALFSQGEWAQNFRPDEDFEFHKIDTAFWGEEVESIKYVNEKDHVAFYVSRPYSDDHVETGYLKNGVHCCLWRRYNETGEVIRSLDFDTLKIQAYDLLKIAKKNGFDLEVYEITFRFDDYWGENSMKYHWIVSRGFHENRSVHKTSGMSVDALSGRESTYGTDILVNPVLPNYDTPPVFDDQYGTLEEFISENSRFAISQEPNSKNAVYVSFKVNTDGALENISTGKANTGAFKREARRLVEMMPNWIPAQRNGKAVECTHCGVRINFE